MKIENIEMKKCSKNLNRKSEINADMPVPAVSKKFVSINLVNRLHLAWEYFGLMVAHMKNWLEGHRFECEFRFVADRIHHLSLESPGSTFTISTYIIIGQISSSSYWTFLSWQYAGRLSPWAYLNSYASTCVLNLSGGSFKVPIGRLWVESYSEDSGVLFLLRLCLYHLPNTIIFNSPGLIFTIFICIVIVQEHHIGHSYHWLESY